MDRLRVADAHQLHRLLDEGSVLPAHEAHVETAQVDDARLMVRLEPGGGGERKNGKGEEKMAKATCGEGKTGRRHVWRKQTCVCACVCVCVTRLC